MRKRKLNLNSEKDIRKVKNLAKLIASGFSSEEIVELVELERLANADREAYWELFCYDFDPLIMTIVWKKDINFFKENKVSENSFDKIRNYLLDEIREAAGNAV